ncbi:hypothetical protein EU546_07665 [Candidatus Thorarchaeota archaeon]|nr:MAG: hypothetical protein EU546_07665 [Candidatus Thorarchaeota archaeon]
MGTIREYYDDVIQRAKDDIDSQDDAYLLGVKANELVQYYVNISRLTKIERDNSREVEYEKGKAISRRARHDSRLIVGRDIPLRIIYPIIPKHHNKTVIQNRASTFRSGGNELEFTVDSLIVTVFLNEDNANQETKIRRAIEEIEAVIDWKNSDVQEGNKKLETKLSRYILQKQGKLKADNELIESIIEKVPITLRRRTTSSPTVDLTVREEIKPVYPTPEKIQEPYIKADRVASVIRLLENGGNSFETTPKVYSKLKEPDLRDILLSHLNIVFEGAATGETFVRRGKTDIHLRFDKGSILCAECKFWHGQKHYLSTMDQLFRYLTWRQNYGILITFSRNKDFTSVVRKAQAAAKDSPTTLDKPLRVIGETHFVTTNGLPEDSRKRVTLHHLLFNLYFGN